jgi:hypothetical protein
VISDREGLSSGASAKKVSKSVSFFICAFNSFLAVSGKPFYDLVDLLLGAALSFDLRYIERVDSRNTHAVDAVLFHEHSVADREKRSQIISEPSLGNFRDPGSPFRLLAKHWLRPSILCRVYQNIKTERFRAPFLFW